MGIINTSFIGSSKNSNYKHLSEEKNSFMCRRWLYFLFIFRALKASKRMKTYEASSHATQTINTWSAFASSTWNALVSAALDPVRLTPKTAISKSRCLKQTLLCLHFINSLNSRVSLNYSCFKSIRRPHCSILFKRSPPKITMSSLFHWHATLSGASVYSFNGHQAKLHLLILQ